MTTIDREALLTQHVADPATGVHRGPLPDESLTYACAACEQDWPCDVVRLAKAVRDLLDWEEKERWAGPHDVLADLIGYYEADR
jgi:hypothetical protein